MGAKVVKTPFRLVERVHLRALVLALVFALALPAFAGCLGSKNDPTPTASTPVDATPTTNATVSENGVVQDASETNRSLGSVAHVHDYWQGRERVVLLDQDVTIDPQTAAFWGLFTTYAYKQPMFGGAFVGLPEGQLVFEGTGELDVTASWTDATVTSMQMTYHDAGSQDFQKVVPLATGQPTKVKVDPGMTDMPHTKNSRWGFIFAAGSNGNGGVAIGKFHLHMEIVKMRDVALFPAHPDFWHGATTLEILSKEGTAHSSQGPQSFARRVTNPLDPPPDMIEGDKVVPMETAYLLVNVTVVSVSPDVKIDHLHLNYHSANMFVTNFRQVPDANATHSADGKEWSWKIPITMNMTDNPYAEKSEWDYMATAAYQNPVPGAQPCDDGCYNVEMHYKIRVTAVKDLTATMPA